MKKPLIFIAAFAAGLIAANGTASIAYADTSISGSIPDDYRLTKTGSPYHLSDDLNVSAGQTLTIDAGVSVDTEPESPNASIIVRGGSIIMNGTAAERISIGRIGHIFVENGNVAVMNTDMRTQGIDLQLYASKADITRSTFSKSTGTGIYALKSRVDIADSQISDNAYAGIVILADPTGMSSFSIHNSIIMDNPQYAVLNKNNTAINAENNWWGIKEGPLTSGANEIVGNISASPWLVAPPDLGLQPPPCCSSILFIPGLEGTRLYRPESWPLSLGMGTNRLWEPNISFDVSKLYLDPDGSSTDQTIYSGAPIDSALGFYDIYGSFMKFLDSLVSNGTVDEWRAFGYDWRKPVTEVVAGVERKATTTASLIDVVERMASSSRTGKVTLIAHSNGGLVAKYLVKMLTDLGKDSLIDTVVSVAVPYLGTPEAIAGLLHGDHQSIFHGLIASQALARGLGVHMPSAYSLLPSAGYFRAAAWPSIAFASSTVPDVNDGSYPQTISKAEDQSSFLTDSHGARTAPAFADTSLPIKGNQFLITAGNALHGLLDPMAWPEKIARWAIIGWNSDTTSGVLYRTAPACSLGIFTIPVCGTRLVHDLLTTAFGDGTVVVPSAAYDPGTAVAVDLKSVSRNEGWDIVHANILESSTTQAILGSIITGGKIPQLDGVASAVPAVAADREPVEIRVSTHSPVELHVFDGGGDHTGPISLPPDLQQTDAYFTGAYETKIPGSGYRAYDNGDGQDIYITLKDHSTSFKVRVLGTGLGFATLDIEKIQGSQVIESLEYSQFPVTPFTSALLQLPGDVFDRTIATSTKLAIDLDGDGVTDIDQMENAGALPATDAGSSAVLALIKTLAGSDPHAAQLLRRFQHLMDLQSKGKLKQVEKQGSLFDLHVGHLKPKSVSDDAKRKIIASLEAMISQAEQGQ